METVLPENDSRPLPPDSTKKSLAGCFRAVTKLFNAGLNTPPGFGSDLDYNRGNRHVGWSFRWTTS